MSKRGRSEGGWLQAPPPTDAVITFHIPVYTKMGSMFSLNFFYVLKVESWNKSHMDWHFRHTPCVIFEGVEFNRFCLLGDDTLRQAPIHQNITWFMCKHLISSSSLSIEPNNCIVQNKTAVILSSGKHVLVCPVFDHEVMFSNTLKASNVEQYASAIQRYQAVHFERAWKHIEFVYVKTVQRAGGAGDEGSEGEEGALELELMKRQRTRA